MLFDCFSLSLSNNYQERYVLPLGGGVRGARVAGVGGGICLACLPLLCLFSVFVPVYVCRCTSVLSVCAFLARPLCLCIRPGWGHYELSKSLSLCMCPFCLSFCIYLCPSVSVCLTIPFCLCFSVSPSLSVSLCICASLSLCLCSPPPSIPTSV